MDSQAPHLRVSWPGESYISHQENETTPLLKMSSSLFMN